MIHKQCWIVLALCCSQLGTPLIAKVPTEVFSKENQIALLKRQIAKADTPVSLTFSKTDIREVLRLFSVEFGMNIISNDDVKGEVSFGFKDIAPIEAFDAIMVSQGFDWHLEGGVIQIYAQQPVEVIQLNYGLAADLASPLAQMLSGKGSITVDNTSNALVIKTSRGDMQRIKQVISELDKRPAQVLVEVAIMDVQGDSSQILGIGPNTTLPNGSTVKQKGMANTFAEGTQGMFVNLIEGNFNVLLEALQSNQNIDLLATPKILAVNHKKATIITGQRLGFRTTTSSTDGNFVSEGVDFLDVGTKLSFTPHIANNGDITMEIKPEVSEGTVSDDGIPNEDSTEAETTVLVRDGQTVLIGGLIREKKCANGDRRPLTFRHSLFGRFFQEKQHRTGQKRDHCVNHPPIGDTREYENRREREIT